MGGAARRPGLPAGLLQLLTSSLLGRPGPCAFCLPSSPPGLRAGHHPLDGRTFPQTEPTFTPAFPFLATLSLPSPSPSFSVTLFSSPSAAFAAAAI